MKCCGRLVVLSCIIVRIEGLIVRGVIGGVGTTSSSPSFLLGNNGRRREVTKRIYEKKSRISGCYVSSSSSSACSSIKSATPSLAAGVHNDEIISPMNEECYNDNIIDHDDNEYITYAILQDPLTVSNTQQLHQQQRQRKRRKRKKYNHQRKVSIQYKSWTGCKGMLPLQKFCNPMDDPSLYRNWLIEPLPNKKSIRHNTFGIDEMDYTKASSSSSSSLSIKKSTSNKKEAEYKASLELDPNEHLCPIYIDSHIVVIHKKSGVLSVPGPRRNPNVANLVHTYFGNEENDVDCMVVHRLDMDTSGVLIYARSKEMLSVLHDSFRMKSMNYGHSGSSSGSSNNSSSNSSNSSTSDDVSSSFVTKTYEALVCGHMNIMEGEIDLPLMRDRLHPPFMKVWTGEGSVTKNNSNEDDENELKIGIANLQKKKQLDKDGNEIKLDEATKIQKHRGYMKMMSKAPKESLTHFRVLGKEYLEDVDDSGLLLPVTRVELVPITGRTHQLRVHCAAIGHPIVGDNIYGIHGDGSANGGFSFEDMYQYYPHMASQLVQEKIFDFVQQSRGKFDLLQKQQQQHHRHENTEELFDFYNGDLCLHARKLHVQHPKTKAPMSFEADPPF